MFRKVIATAALSGALALGITGVAAADATTPAPSTPGAVAHTPDCSKAPHALARIAKLEAKAQNFVTKAQAREANAQQAGNTARANKIAARITKVQGLEAKGNTLVQKIQAKCPGATAAPAS